jgi:peptidoglycan L-alanyl-D-glutamate endopeptidase CwlK
VTPAQRTEANLVGVKDDIAVIAREVALEIPSCVTEGVRKLDRQKYLLGTGASSTLNSRHLTGDAVDQAPLDANGEICWDWDLVYEVAEVWRRRAKAHAFPCRWGGAWDIDFTASTKPCKQLAEEYQARRKAAGKKILFDGVHFERRREKS